MHDRLAIAASPSWAVPVRGPAHEGVSSRSSRWQPRAGFLPPATGTRLLPLKERVSASRRVRACPRAATEVGACHRAGALARKTLRPSLADAKARLSALLDDVALGRLVAAGVFTIGR